jgi:outer membrane protein assembly factor BamB
MYAMWGSKQRGALVGAVAATLLLPQAATAAPFKNFQADPAHDGHHRGDALHPPLVRAWSRDLGGSTSYPVIVGGRIFVTVANRGYTGTSIVALDAGSGRTLWSHALAGNYRWSNATYASGLVVNVADTGWLTAYRPATGAVAWTKRISGPFAAPPTASRGIVYVSTESTWYEDRREDHATGGVYAVRARDGRTLWRRPVLYGFASSPTVGRDVVFENYGCGQVYALNRLTGATAWHYDSGCAGGGGATAVLYRGELWTRETYPREDPIVFDARTGAERRHFKPSLDPAFAFGIGYFPRYPGLEASAAATGTRRWRTTHGGPFVTPPLIAGSLVYVGAASGRVYAFDAHDGTLRWHADTGATFDGDNPSSVGQPTNGLGAGGGMLVAPNARGVVAYRPKG